jgi:hypothetical protein
MGRRHVLAQLLESPQRRCLDQRLGYRRAHLLIPSPPIGNQCIAWYSVLWRMEREPREAVSSTSCRAQTIAVYSCRIKRLEAIAAWLM